MAHVANGETQALQLFEEMNCCHIQPETWDPKGREAHPKTRIDTLWEFNIETDLMGMVVSWEFMVV